MKRWEHTAATAAGAVAGSAAAAAVIGNALWNWTTARAVDRLRSDGVASSAGVSSREQLEGLPEPVVRYFQFTLTPGQPLVRSARIRHKGQMRLGGFDAPWRPFTSVQHVSTRPPGFVWDATFRMAPIVSVRVRDSYLGGIGSMQARLAGLIPVVDQSGRPELAAGSLQRYLAEAPWYPPALLPGHGLAWESIDDTRARAVLTAYGTTVSMEYQFAPNGAIEQTYTPARFREVNDAYVPTPWVGVHRSYAPVRGMQVPMEGEVEWILLEGRLPVWRGRVQSVDYDFDR